MSLTFFLIASPGLEPLVLEEVRQLGYTQARALPGGVSVKGTARDLYRCNLHSSMATRILLRIATFRATRFSELQRQLSRIDWSAYLTPLEPVLISSSSHTSQLYHSGAVSKVALEVLGKTYKPVVKVGDLPETEMPAAQIQLRMAGDTCTVSMDSSGAPLYQRGYRTMISKAPLRETIAAALLRTVAWNPSIPLLDPFCGSGVIPIEAARLAAGIAPGAQRTFAFQRWPSFNKGAWASLRGGESKLPLASTDAAPGPILGSDSDEGIVAAAASNAGRAEVASLVSFSSRSATTIAPPANHGIILSNPPFGERLGNTQQLDTLYRTFGNVLRESFSGWQVALLAPTKRTISSLQIPLEEKLCLIHGGTRIRLYVANL